MKTKCFIKQEEWNDITEIYLLGYNETDDFSSFYTFEDGHLVGHIVKIDEIPTKPFMVFDGKNATRFLPALVEGFAKAGFVAEADNAQRITSEAVSKEREKEIIWLRGLVEKQLQNKS